jgi:hypothetical protein
MLSARPFALSPPPVLSVAEGLHMNGNPALNSPACFPDVGTDVGEVLE